MWYASLALGGGGKVVRMAAGGAGSLSACSVQNFLGAADDPDDGKDDKTRIFP